VTVEFRQGRVLPGYQPVFCTREHVYLFRRNWLWRADHDLGERVRLARIPADRSILSLGPRIVERVFRTAIQSAALCGPGTLLLARRSRIWRVDLATGDVALDLAIPDGRGLLAFGRIVSAASGTEWLVFGEYFNNPDRAAVRLWRRRTERDARWEVAAVIPAGQINHVHALHQLGNGAVYVLTGDFDGAAGFWQVDDDITDPRPIRRGKQRFRACWWFEHGGSVVYGTDSQFEVNRLLSLQPGDGEDDDVQVIADLPGSCIYHGRTGAGLVFSTTVEPGASTGSFARDAVNRSVGPGITGDPAIFHYSDELTRVFSAPKDAWPPRLGQFGTFMFPAGAGPDDRFHAYGVAVKDYDGACLTFHRR